jgi:hypothetical protein
VIDLIGQHRKEFRFADRLSAIVDRRRGPIIDQVEAGFPFLPPGCSLDLDRQSSEVVLKSLKEATRRSLPARMIADLRQAGEAITLAGFLDPARYDHRVEDVYRGNRSWTWLRREVGFETAEPHKAELEELALRNLSRLTHIDDPERCRFYAELLASPEAPDLSELNERHLRLVTMLAWDLGSGRSGRADLSSFLDDLWREQAVRDELLELLAYLEGQSRTRSVELAVADEVPLSVHARYSREEIVAALGSGDGVKPRVTQGGILWVPEAGSDCFFIDLHKAERDYSPSTMYRDYAINRELFHWESQSRQAPHQPTVQRYINHREQGSQVLLFVRDRKKGELGTMPFTFLGPAEYVSHKGERPVQFVWRLATPMPAELFESARSVAAA